MFASIFNYCISGYYSWRHTVKGSWFIQGLCEVIEQYVHEENVIDMLTRVGFVATKENTDTYFLQILTEIVYSFLMEVNFLCNR